MTVNNLSVCIAQSLKNKEMVPEFVDSLLSHNHLEILHRDETEMRDYKQELDLDNPHEVAQFAKDILGFHNTKGGVIIVGVSKDYKVIGVHQSQIWDTSRLIGKIRKYIGPDVSIFQNSIQIPSNKFIWLIFIQKRSGDPQLFLENGPDGKDSKPIIRKDACFMRVNDETKPCIDTRDYVRLFSGRSTDQLHAYIYDIDTFYFRLLTPHCDRFVGREPIIKEIIEALELRQPIIALDGVGGVGKSAIAIELIRRLYESENYMFIISLSAKNKVWHNFTGSRKAGFSGLTELLQEIAKVMGIPFDLPVEALKQEIISQMEGNRGLLLIDNIEDEKEHSEVLQFLKKDVPPPVKVIVTTRVNKNIGALTISVPQMTIEEARELLYHEFYKVGYKNFLNELDDIDEILSVTGGLPLALKWAAALAESSKSLRQVSQTLRQSNATKKEFLNFCFATMFDTLSSLAQDVAMLCPYLGEEWNNITISIALNAQFNSIKDAIDELSDRGILLASGTGDEKGYHLLPFTLDYLSSKWYENVTLRDKVHNNLADALASDDGDGLLFKWTDEKKVEFLIKRIMELIEKEEYEKAYKLSDLATQWSKKPEILFLHGKIDYYRHHYRDGIFAMKTAVRQIKTDGILNDEDKFFLGKALMIHGQNADQKLSIELMEDAIPFAKQVSEKDIKEFCAYLLSLREYSLLRRLLEKTGDIDRIFCIVESVWDSLESGQVIHVLGNSIVTALRLIASQEETFNIPRHKLLEKATSINKLLNQR